LSITERYSSESIFLDRITTSAQSLVKQRLLLEEDVPRLRKRAAKEWDYVMGAN
jgi:hypothetical protein